MGLSWREQLEEALSVLDIMDLLRFLSLTCDVADLIKLVTDQIYQLLLGRPHTLGHILLDRLNLKRRMVMS